MARLVGVEIPDAKRTVVALTYIFGVGSDSAEKTCKALNINPDVRAKDLSDEELASIASHLEDHYLVEGALRRTNTQAINRLRDIQCYRGSRHRRGLPCRGQRTKTNARSRKGPKKTVAGKKSVKAMK
ncbi:MAG: 30S ribosomal protein S13 [Planctomycetota bacterium]|jgi:small subunit ribosomal protein S13|nr:30S ribosomal protein S13 [Planctomycetota bacterium]